MERVIIFGAGSTGQQIYESVKNTMEVIGFLDNERGKWGVLSTASQSWEGCRS